MLLIACGSTQPLLTRPAGCWWERTGKLPPNAEGLVVPRYFNPTFEVRDDAPVLVWPGKAWICTIVGSQGAARTAQRGSLRTLSPR